MSDDNVVRASGIIVYTDANDTNEIKFLLLRASSKPFHWTPPKGRLDKGENAMDAAFRETFEEAGLDRSSYVLDEGFKETLYYKAHNLDKECIYHLARLADPSAKVVLSHEHTEYKWVKLEDIPNYCDKDNLRQMFINAHNYLTHKSR